MLAKLLKYDLKDIFGFLSVLYLITFAVSVCTRIFFSIENSIAAYILAQIFTGVCISMVFNIVINNTMRVWVKFKSSIYGDRSYLTHTLPVKKSNIYLSKIISAGVTLSASFLVIAAAFFVAYYTKDLFGIIKKIITPLSEIFGFSTIGIIVVLVAILFLEIFNIIQCGFTGIILGHRRNNGKGGFSVLFGFIAFTASQLAVILVTLFVGLFDENIKNIFFTNSLTNLGSIKTIFFLCLVIYFVIGLVGIFINIKLLKKGVNVD